MTGDYALMHSGWSKYHHVGLIVPVISAVLPFIIAPYVERVIGKRHHIVMALLLGSIVAGVAYILLKYVPVLQDTNYTGSKAVLLGLLSAELMIFTTPHGKDLDERMISAPLLIFFIFMYLLGVGEVETDNTL